MFCQLQRGRLAVTTNDVVPFFVFSPFFLLALAIILGGNK
jgi:hypothetical protein